VLNTVFDCQGIFLGYRRGFCLNNSAHFEAWEASLKSKLWLRQEVKALNYEGGQDFRAQLLQLMNSHCSQPTKGACCFNSPSLHREYYYILYCYDNFLNGHGNHWALDSILAASSPTVEIWHSHLKRDLIKHWTQQQHNYNSMVQESAATSVALIYADELSLEGPVAARAQATSGLTVMLWDGPCRVEIFCAV